LKEYDIDVLALQEIKVHLDDIPEEIKKLPGYHCYFNSAEKRGYSGTAILTREKPSSVDLGLGEPQIDLEGRVIRAKIGRFDLINFYFPHSSRDLHRLEFKHEFNKSAIKYITEKLGENLIVCGDFNVAHQEIDLARPKQNAKNAGFTPGERADFDKILGLGLVDAFRERYPDKQVYTWWGHFYNMRARNIGWRIDYFLIPRMLLPEMKSVEIASDVFGSDHCPVIIEMR